MQIYHPAISIALLLAFLTVSHSRHIVQTSQNTIQSALSNFGVCLTPECVRAAQEISTNMDETVYPCDNFYRFACGGYLKHTEIPEERSIKNVFYDVQSELDKNLLELLEKEPDTSDPPYVEMLKNMYDSCMDLDAIEREGAEPLKRRLSVLGGWPVVEGRRWDESKFDWMDSLTAMRRLGFSVNIIFAVALDPDLRNNKVNILSIDQAVLGMPDRSYLVTGLSDPKTAAYFQGMVNAAKLLGADESTARSELLKALNFEMTLANYSMADEDRRDFNKLYNKYTIGELQILAPQVPWLKYFSGLLNGEVDEDEPLIVPNPDFIDKIAALIPATEKRVIANYMMWRVFQASIGILSSEWWDVSKEYDELLSGSKEAPPRSVYCLGPVSGTLGIALSSYYVKNYFDEDSKEAALVLVEYVKQEFLKILSRIDWMDEDTKREAIEKAKAIKPNIGYPPELVDEAVVMKYYENLTTLSGNYYDNMQSLRIWSDRFDLSHLRKPVVKGNWITHARVIEVNAFYNYIENCIDFPAGILQKALFDKDRPFYMNFGSIGFVVGHEITHGFDDTGRQFDKEGINVNWWNKDTDELFTKKAQCIIDQYGNYTVENGMKLNAINTQGENIADNGGLKEAYWAYRSWVEDNGPEQTLPGLDYTPNQLFWISTANAWCSKYRPEMLELMIIADAHSPAEYRINGPLSNFQEFSRDFNCPLGSPMNKPHKCQVW